MEADTSVYPPCFRRTPKRAEGNAEMGQAPVHLHRPVRVVGIPVTAILDRLLHHSVVLNIDGNSCRHKKQLNAAIMAAKQ